MKQAHSLRLLPRLTEARNIDYPFSGKSSNSVRLRIKIYLVELEQWRRNKLNPIDSQAAAPNTTRDTVRADGVAAFGVFSKSADVMLPKDNHANKESVSNKKQLFLRYAEYAREDFNKAIEPHINRLYELNRNPNELFFRLKADVEKIMSNIEKEEKELLELTRLDINDPMQQINKNECQRTAQHSELPVEFETKRPRR